MLAEDLLFMTWPFTQAQHHQAVLSIQLRGFSPQPGQKCFAVAVCAAAAAAFPDGQQIHKQRWNQVSRGSKGTAVPVDVGTIKMLARKILGRAGASSTYHHPHKNFSSHLFRQS